MKKQLTIFGVIISIVSFGLGSAFAADNMPSAKAAAAIDALISLRSDSVADAYDNNSNSDNSGAWSSILTTYIKTPNQKELAFDVALQCGLITDTTVRSKGGAKDGAEAEGKIRVRVKITHPDGSVTYADPKNELVDPFDTSNTNIQDGITYCNRFQELAANFAGLNCWAAAPAIEGYCDGAELGACDDTGTGLCTAGNVDAPCTTDAECDVLGSCTAGLVGNDCMVDDNCDDPGGADVVGDCREDDGICIAGAVGEECTVDADCDTTLLAGQVYCEDPEELQLVLRTPNAHAFNFLAKNVPPGVQQIDVEAKAETNAALSGTMFGEAKSTALVGVGSMMVESVRMIKDDVPTL